MKKLILSFITVLTLAFSARAQDSTLVSAVTAATPATLLTGGKYTIVGLKFINANTTNSGQVWFYDTAAAATNYAKGAYTAYSSYATNYSTTFTNTGGIVITNTWTGTYRQATAVSAVTNEAPKMLGPFAIPVSSTTEIDAIAVAPNVGATVYSTVAGTLQVTYRTTNP